MKYQIVVDTMGYENKLEECLRAVLDFINKHMDTLVYLVGNERAISDFFGNDERIKIIHASEEITQSDTIITSRRKPDSSMKIALEFLNKNDQIDGLLSAGNTSVFVYLSYSTIGLLDHVKKPGFMPLLPTYDNIGTNIVDVGANLNVDEYDLLNWAIMGNAIAKTRVDNPKIGIINIGVEDHKGYDYHQKANQLLKNSTLNYIGFIEPNKVLYREADIYVSDGYAGNLVLKSMEGTAKFIADFLKTNYKKPKNWLGALFSVGVLKNLKKTLNYKNKAGAFVVGLKKMVVKTHGSADYEQFSSALLILYNSIKDDVLNKIKKDLKDYYGR
ncbi:phosphate acyltransferase PlsX [Ureaplasma canigenitalium]|uniref:phosphate acyltransferase PlsX n=1 Tax=Ureaplasma canigenitalium TaxID=42092 RepID=UPI0004E26B76|nr:phosphate acyltransferase PlsX [Ureaplasma canigenitalium]